MQPYALTPTFFAERHAEIDPSLSAAIFADLQAAGLLNATGFSGYPTDQAPQAEWVTPFFWVPGARLGALLQHLQQVVWPAQAGRCPQRAVRRAGEVLLPEDGRHGPAAPRLHARLHRDLLRLAGRCVAVCVHGVSEAGGMM